MKSKVKWFLAIVFTLAVIGLTKIEENNYTKGRMSDYVTTGKDFLVMKKWIASYFNANSEELLSVQYDDRPFGHYESIQPYQEGVILSYSQPLSIAAEGDGLIIFTGITRKTGKTITVLYDDGDEVTYGFVGSFLKLPYTSIKQGEPIALMDEEALFLMVKRDGKHIDPSLLPAYLSGKME